MAVGESWMEFMGDGEVLTDTNIDYSEDSLEWDGKPLPESFEPDNYDDEVTYQAKVDIYYRQVKESGGFDVDSVDVPECDAIGPMFELFDYLDDLAEAGLEWLKNKGDYSDYVFSKVMKANEEAAVLYYITFEAKNSSGVSKIFQTLVYRSFPKEDGSRTVAVDSCRVKPGQEGNSSEEISENGSVLKTRLEENSSKEISDNYIMLETRQEENSSEEISDNDYMFETMPEVNSSEEISHNDNMLETRHLKRKWQEDRRHVHLDTMLDE